MLGSTKFTDERNAKNT